MASRNHDTVDPGSGRVLEDYRRYLLRERRVATLTSVTRIDVIRRFLAQRATRADLGLPGLTVGELHAFLLGESPRLAVSTMRVVVDALRSFARFLFATGVVPRDLSGAIPGAAGARYCSPPRLVDAGTVRLLLARVGVRDFAILTLVARLGLHANEIALMRLDDIDWRAGTLLVHGKGGRHERLPLPADVGKALAGYLRAGRPRSASRSVFLSAQPPVEPMSRNAVVMVPRGASARVGISVIGAHRLRHTAMNLLQAGVDVATIALWLGHSGLKAVQIYLHADLTIKGASGFSVGEFP